MSIVIELILAALFLAAIHRQPSVHKQPVAVRVQEHQ